MSVADSINCPHCRGSIADDPSLAGQLVSCPHCNGQLTMPQRATVRVVKPSSGQGFPAVDTSSKTTSTVGSRYRKKRKQIVPIKYWILGGGGLLFFAMVLFTILDEPRVQREYKQKQERLAAELPDNATGRQWVRASKDAKKAIVERIGPSWTYMDHGDVIDGVDTHYDWAQKGIGERSINDPVRKVIDNIVAREKSDDEQRRRDYWTHRAEETDDPDMRNEYIRRALHDP